MKIIKALTDRYRRYRTRRWELKLWRADVVERQKISKLFNRRYFGGVKLYIGTDAPVVTYCRMCPGCNAIHLAIEETIGGPRYPPCPCGNVSRIFDFMDSSWVLKRPLGYCGVGNFYHKTFLFYEEMFGHPAGRHRDADTPTHPSNKYNGLK